VKREFILGFLFSSLIVFSLGHGALDTGTGVYHSSATRSDSSVLFLVVSPSLPPPPLFYSGEALCQPSSPNEKSVYTDECYLFLNVSEIIGCLYCVRIFCPPACRWRGLDCGSNCCVWV
jgi:hypothetical protein